MAVATLLIIIIVAGAWLYFKTPNPQLITSNIVLTNSQNQDFYINAELADTSLKRTKGLMNRTSLDSDAGMLFTFSDEATRSFWMKNTLIPLDIIFISEAGQIVDIKHNFEPCKTINCPAYTSKLPAKYVLEVNSGYAKQNNINIGDKITINDNLLD